MTWDVYVKQQLLDTKKISKAGIYGRENGNAWATKEDNLKASQAEVQTILQSYSNPDSLRTHGIKVHGEKFMFLSADEQFVRGKKGANTLITFITNQTIIIAETGENGQAGDCSTLVGKLGDYLIEHGY